MNLETIINAARNSVQADSHISRQLLSEIDCITWAPDYAEPGYSCDPAKGVVFANWNSVSGRDPITGYYNKKHPVLQSESPREWGSRLPRLPTGGRGDKR